MRQRCYIVAAGVDVAPVVAVAPVAAGVVVVPVVAVAAVAAVAAAAHSGTV